MYTPPSHCVLMSQMRVIVKNNQAPYKRTKHAEGYGKSKLLFGLPLAATQQPEKQKQFFWKMYSLPGPISNALIVPGKLDANAINPFPFLAV